MLTLKLKRHGASYSVDSGWKSVLALCDDVAAGVLECGRNELPITLEVLISKTHADVDRIRGNGFRLKPYLPSRGTMRHGMPWYEFVEVGWKDGELLYPEAQIIKETEPMVVIVGDSTETRNVICLHEGALDVLIPIANDSMDDIFVIIREV